MSRAPGQVWPGVDPLLFAELLKLNPFLTIAGPPDTISSVRALSTRSALQQPRIGRRLTTFEAQSCRFQALPPTLRRLGDSSRQRAQ